MSNDESYFLYVEFGKEKYHHVLFSTTIGGILCFKDEHDTTPSKIETLVSRDRIAAEKIQKVWRRCISDPNYQMCKKRLLREFEEQRIFFM